MKRFFSSMEERFVFPIGRRTWQILALIALLVLVLSAIYFIVNSTPTGKDSVKVSKNEVVENKIDTVTSVAVTEQVCEEKDYTAWVDTIKADLPNAEWTNLGDSSEAYESYYEDENGNYVSIMKRDFVPNSSAIPNILNFIYNKKGLDSTSVCEKIEVLKTLHALNVLIETNFLNESGIYLNAEVVSNYNVDAALVNQSVNLYSAIEDKKPRVTDNGSYNDLIRYIYYVMQNRPSSERINPLVHLLSEHRKLTNAKYSKNEYFPIAEIVFEANIDDENLSKAVDDFTDDIGFYDENGLKNSLKKYFKLYQEKLDRAEADQIARINEKEINRGKSLLAAGGAFLSVVSIATILLLFSIQSLLKRHMEKKD